jgi:hypothetical protein
MGATRKAVPQARFEFDEDEPGISASTPDRLHAVQALIKQGETEESIARFIAGQEEFTETERIFARLILRRHGLARHAA